jgi:RecB family exonuclease
LIGTKEQPLRVSRFRDFLECPERFYLQEVEGARPKTRSGVAVMGTVRHRLLYHIHKEGIERFDKWVPEEWWVWATQALDTEVATGQDSDLPVYWKDEEKERRDFGTECMMIFPNYIKAPQNRECKVILAEAPFKVEINGVWFESQGIDQLRELPDGTLELLDFKTGDRRPDQLFIDLNTQLAIYAYAVWKGIFWGEGDIGGHTDPEMVGTSFRVGRLPDVASIYHLKDHEPYKRKTGDKEKGEERGPGRYVSKIPCSEARMKVLEEEVEKVFTAMRWDLRYRNPGACITCHVKESCLAGVLGDALTPEMMATIGEEDLDAE